MKYPSDILDETFGKLSLIRESEYHAEVLWNRDISIRLIIHVDGENYQKCIGNAKNTFLAARENELELVNQGVEYLVSNGTISEEDDDEFKDYVLHSAAETSIHIDFNGEGKMVYLVLGIGSLIVAFSRDAVFQDAYALQG